MTTRRIQKDLNQTTGKPLSFAERSAARRKEHNEQTKQEQLAQQEAKRQAAFLPPPERPLTFDERKDIRQAEKVGRLDAEYKAEKIAEETAPERNPYRARVDELAGRLYIPGNDRKLIHISQLADNWDREQLAKQEAAARQAIIDNSPEVRTARDYADGLVKLAPDEFKTEAAECAGIAQAGDAKLAWQRLRDLEERIYQHQDRIAAEKLASKSVTDAEFQEAANKATEARERFEKSASMVEPPGETTNGE